MPVISWAYLAFIAGLLGWYSGIYSIQLALAAGFLLFPVARPNSISILMIAVFCAGVLVAIGNPPPKSRFNNTVDENSYFERKRQAASRKLEVIFRHNAPMAKALLIADQSEISKQIKDEFARSGLIHMLSISGLHVSIIAGFVGLVFQLMRIPKQMVVFSMIATLIYYVSLLGYPPPAVRAATMVAVMAASQLTQRPTSRWAALALGAFIPLTINPVTVLNLGYQLSVGGIAGLIASAGFCKRLVKGRVQGVKYTILKSLITSTIATLVTAPLVGWTFGVISLIGPISNLIADPVIALLQPVLFLTLVISPLTQVATYIADASSVLLWAFEFISRTCAAAPWAAVTINPTPASAIIAIVATVSMVIACVSQWPARASIVCIASTAALILM